MCLILFAYQHHSSFPLVLAANRDEYFERATRAAEFWPDSLRGQSSPQSAQILAGRDLVAGGTWMGITRTGRIAAVTNFRGPTQIKGNLSRGQLCADFLQSDISSRAYAQQVLTQSSQYAGFNLLVFDGRDFIYCSNQNTSSQNQRFEELTPGIYGLSNGTLDAPWPKIEKGKQGLKDILTTPHIQSEQLLTLLHDDEIAQDQQLPDTGVGLERERLLSPLFIRAGAGGYGTCNSTALLIDQNGLVNFHERSFYQAPRQASPTDKQFQFPLLPA